MGQRKIKKLRISLLDECNSKCVYCRPNIQAIKGPSSVLSVDELVNICQILTEFGVDEFRLTGGEPTLRRDLLEVVSKLSMIPSKKLGITSNGIKLFPLLNQLQHTNCKYINISLDSLNKSKFQLITRSDAFSEVLKSVLGAKEYGFAVKINTVLMKGLNDDEIEDFIEFSAQYKVEVRFLELMKIGTIRDQFENLFISADEVMAKIKTRWSCKQLPMPQDSTSKNFALSNGAHIGFIASESQPFCQSCSRLRLSADGTLRPCLMMGHGENIKGASKDAIEEVINHLVEQKPWSRIKESDQSMYKIGG
ncbi:MAG: radical SAM protein [Bacteriovoracaceae bacterium]|nr:radical SAM protein [Bacteriovoracaceae bacterium]